MLNNYINIVYMIYINTILIVNLLMNKSNIYNIMKIFNLIINLLNQFKILYNMKKIKKK